MRTSTPRLARFVAILVVCCCVREAVAGPGPAWKAGRARAKITPEQAMWMAGYGSRTQPAQGTLHDLWIKALALDDGAGRRAVLVTADLLGFPQGMYDQICAEVEQRHGIKRASLMLNCSHTHSGPVLRGALYDIYPLDDVQRALIDAYSTRLERAVVDLVGRALADLRPAVLGHSQGTCPFAANRRENKEADVVALRAAGKPTRGPSDHDVPVLAVRDPAGRTFAIVFGYACHNTTLCEYEWCGDYAGFAQIDLEKAHPGVQAMFVEGCGADQNPMPRRSVELCRAHGAALAAAVDRALQGPGTQVRPQLETGHEFVTLDFDAAPSRAELQETAGKGGYQARWAKRLLGEIDCGVRFATSYRYPVQAWKLGGDLLWIALGGEVVVDYALRFKKRFGPRTWIAGYTNDVMAYIPSRRVRDEGRYEAGAFAVYGLPATAWSPDIEERIAAAVGRIAH